MNLTLGISPCPNDTFIFDALVNRKIDTRGLSFSVRHEDVETLNREAFSGTFDITKLSFAAWANLNDQYSLLKSGAALGRGVGPLLVARNALSREAIYAANIALPGEHTTAHFLFNHFYPAHPQKRFMPFDKIETWALQAAEPAAGVIIHESRFTYKEKGLVCLTDLGTEWENQTGLPIPLGCIAMKSHFDKPLQETVTELIRESLRYAWKHYPQLSDYVTAHAQEMEPEVMRRHIELYVNDYSLNLDEAALQAIGSLQKALAE